MRRSCRCRRTKSTTPRRSPAPPRVSVRPAWAWSSWTASGFATSHGATWSRGSVCRCSSPTCSSRAWPRSCSRCDVGARALMNPRTRLLLLLPFTALLGVFFAAPLLLMVLISVSRQSFGEMQWAFTLHHYARFFSDAYYVGVLWDTLVLGAIVTVVSLLLGYPVAYHLARTRSRLKPLLLVAILSPLLVGIVIRCYGWMILLADRGLINATLVERGWIARPLPLMYNRFGVAVALVHVFLPFMVLSLTGVLKRIDPHVLEAAMTLGASPGRTFLEVTLPLSLPGILAGSLLVFSLAISSFVVPVLLGGFKVQVLPMIVYEQVLSVFDWPFGAANAFVLLIISIALIAGYIRLTERALRGIA